jgi:Kef-type K+ transport system membrane component KefB
MTDVWLRAALWLGLALAATLISIRLRVATALSEIVVGTVAQLLIGAFIGTELLGTAESWIAFLSSTGAVFLTFLAGAELDPAVLRAKWRETGLIGLVSFAAPFLGSAAYAHYVLGWGSKASWLTGVALSTTSVAVVYAVMLELGLNSTGFGKAVLAACFVCDLGTVVALGLIFAPFTYGTLVFALITALVIGVLPWVTPRFFRAYGGRPSEPEAKYLLLVLFALGGAAAWADSEAVLPAYLVGMVLAGTVGKDHALIRRLRTLTFGFLTPFYYEQLFASLRRQAQERNVNLQTHVLVGHPADQILKPAQKYGADLIVVGHRGRSAIREWVSGSTSRRVVAHASCQVLVVRAR